MAHVVINSIAQREMLERHGLETFLIPNAFDFETMGQLDDFNSDFREAHGLAERDVIFLQPSRIIPRKCIERSLELIARLQPRLEAQGRHGVLLITGPPQASERRDSYYRKLWSLAKKLNV